MIKLTDRLTMIREGKPAPATLSGAGSQDGRKKTMASEILAAHNRSGDPGRLALRFDSLISHDITYVGIIQTAMASGLKEFLIPYVLTNCHNSLCAVGGTINEDDHAFGLSAARKFGGIYVPANMAVIHQYAREELAGVGRMILGSDSHTRYGALGAMGIGEGGPELVKQLLGSTWEAKDPEVILVWLTGTPRRGVGPHDVAIALCGAVYKNGFAKNRILEFAGPGVASLPADYRMGIDVMTTEMAALSSIWQTDEIIEAYYRTHGKPENYRRIKPKEGALYDGLIEIDLSEAEPMAALAFHPSEAVTLRELLAAPETALQRIEDAARRLYGEAAQLNFTDKIQNGSIMVDQGIIAGCAGGLFDNITEAAAIIDGGGTGTGNFSLSVYPASLPVNLELVKSGAVQTLMEAGVIMKPAFCGPCFGAGDVPANNGLSIRHTTRNFPSREGARPGEGQFAAVLLMDSRSIAATARNHGILTSALDIGYDLPGSGDQGYDPSPYEKRIYRGFGDPRPETVLQYGPNIAPWPKIPALGEHLLIRLAAVIHDPVTTTDELIPSGEAASYRSNPMKLAAFTLSRREPQYVPRALAIQAMEQDRRSGILDPDVLSVVKRAGLKEANLADTHIASAIFCESPGDGSAREQAASCQRVLGGAANIARSYATRRYRSNCVNWGMLPFLIDEGTPFDYEPQDWLFIPNIRQAVAGGADHVQATIITKFGTAPLALHLPDLTAQERKLILAGSLMNWYAANNTNEGE